jgi:hypothetical protein
MDFIMDIIGYILAGAAVVAITNWIQNSKHKPISIDKNVFFTLTMHSQYKKIGVFSSVMGVFLTFIVIFILSDSKLFDENESIDNTRLLFILFIISFFLSFLIHGLYILLEYKNHKVAFNNEIIKVTSVYNTTKEIQWKDIIAARFSHISGVLTLETQSDSVRVHQGLDRFIKFVRHLETHTSWTRKQLRIPDKPINVTELL